jgi:hypothetical protein
MAPAEADDAEWMSGKSRNRLAPVLTEASFMDVGPKRARGTKGKSLGSKRVERRHGTDRGQNARKSRRSYRFSKDWEVHVAMSYFTAYRSNFCWPVRTLRTKAEDGRWQQRTPGMAAGLADHVWTLEEWINFPAIQCK